MKDLLIIAAVVAATIAMGVAATYGIRLASNAGTPITVHDVAAGVKCATMMTGDGVAIDCWRIK